MLEKPAVTQVAIADVIARRWSPRAMNPTKPVSREQLLALLEAARWAPSCYGDQPWRYLVWDRFGDPVGWQRAFECLAEGNQVWVKNAALLLLSVAAPNFQHNGKLNRFAQHDTGAASANLALQATALGLALHQMGIRRRSGQVAFQHSHRSYLHGDDRGGSSRPGRRFVGRPAPKRSGVANPQAAE